MVWTCDANERREDTYENATKKVGGKRPRRRPITRWIDLIRRNIGMRGVNKEKIQKTRK